jgi:hypothetical protein
LLFACPAEANILAKSNICLKKKILKKRQQEQDPNRPKSEVISLQDQDDKLYARANAHE